MNEEELKKDQLPQILHVKDLQVLLSISHNTAYELNSVYTSDMV